MANLGSLRRLKAGAKAFIPGRSDNLTCVRVYPGQVSDPLQTFYLPIQNAVAQGNFEQAASLVESYRLSPIRSTMGTTLSVKAFYKIIEGFVGDDGHAHSNIEKLKALEAWHARRPECPIAVSALISALSTTAHSCRGTDVARKVSRKQWQGMAHYNERAETLITYTQQRFGTSASHHPVFTLVALDAALTSGVGQPDRMARFQMAMNANTYCESPYGTIAYQLLPRWHGSFDAIASLAAWCADQTQAQFGQSAYYHMYYGLNGALDFSEIRNLDPARYLKGGQDALKRNPSQVLATQLASDAFELGKYDTCQTLLEGLSEFHENNWQPETDIHIANSICREVTGR